MDYDAGSKLYWFDDYGQYRLPERYKVPVSYLVSPNAVTDTSISFRQNSNSVYDKETGTTYSYLDNNWITRALEKANVEADITNLFYEFLKKAVQ
jgi:hypothetical protein